MLRVENLNIALGKKRTLVTESFQINNGLWALLGRNGSGKSTFLNTLAHTPSSPLNGKVYIDNKLISDWHQKDLARMISMVYTKPSVFGNFTAFDVIKLGRLPYSNVLGIVVKDNKESIDMAVDLLDIGYLVNKSFSVLSDGEKQLVMIGRAIAQDTPIMLLDEPTAFLDVVNRLKIVEQLKKISDLMGKTIVFSTHDLMMVPELCDGLLWIDNDVLKSTTAKEDFTITINNLFKKNNDSPNEIQN